MLQQQRGGDGEDDAQDDGGAATGEDGEPALLSGQPRCGGPNNQCVVAAQRQVHQDNPTQHGQVLKHVQPFRSATPF